MAAWVLLLAACGPAEREPVAPFGGRLATPLPYGDVLGFLRFRPDDELARAAAAGLAGVPVEWKGSVVGPSLKVLELATGPAQPFGGAGAPLVVLFLDPGVHGAVAAFAWRGDASAFRDAARAAGLRLRGEDAVELPGRGRMEGHDIVALLTGLRGGDLDEDAEGSAVPPRVVYHLVERDGVSLLAPARDGARNLLATLAATGALAEDDVDECARIDLGSIARGSRDDVRSALNVLVEAVIGRIPGADEMISEEREFRRGHREVWPLRARLRRLFGGALEAGSTVEHFFARRRGARIEAYLLAEPDGFLRKALGAAANRPMAQLVAGVPPDAVAALAFSVEAERIATLPALLAAAQRGPFAQQFEIDRADAVAEDDRPSFLDSFGGRAWVALTQVDADAGGLGLRVRLFSELVDDEAGTGLLGALVETLPSTWRDLVKTQSLLTYRIQRVAGGAIEVVGSEPGPAIQREVARLAAPETFPVPWDGPEQAFAVFSFAWPPHDPRSTLSLTRDERGVHLVLTLP